MITGVHAVLFTRDADALREFLRDVLELPSVDAGGGWLIFGLPPAELAAHPSEDPAPAAAIDARATSTATKGVERPGRSATSAGRTALALAARRSTSRAPGAAEAGLRPEAG